MLDNRRRLVLSPFAIIWNSPDLHHFRAATGDVALMDINDLQDVYSGASETVHICIEGNVFLRDDTPTGPSLKKTMPTGPLSFVDLDESILDGGNGLPFPSNPK